MSLYDDIIPPWPVVQERLRATIERRGFSVVCCTWRPIWLRNSIGSPTPPRPRPPGPRGWPMTKRERPQIVESEAATNGFRVHPDPTAPARPAPSQAYAADGELPEGVVTLPQALAELSAILLLVRDTLNRQADDRPRVEPLTLRFDDLATPSG